MKFFNFFKTFFPCLLVFAIQTKSVTASAQSSEVPVATFKQSYLLCSSHQNSYSLILENAGIGEATAISLIHFENGQWKELTKRPITEINRTAGSFPEQFVKEYRGQGFTAIRSVGVDASGFWNDQLELSIKLGADFLKSNFTCSSVE